MHFDSLHLLGAAMQHWHGSMGDPIYAVGSFYFAGQEYPWPHIVLEARDSLQSFLDNPHPSWTKDDLDELRKIIADLNDKITLNDRK